MVHCDGSKVIWNTFQTLWGNVLKCPKQLSEKQILLGDSNFSPILNHIIIIVKKTIYDCRLKNVLPSFNIVRMNVSSTKEIEYYIAKRRQLTTLFNKKWKDFVM